MTLNFACVEFVKWPQHIRRHETLAVERSLKARPKVPSYVHPVRMQAKRTSEDLFKKKLSLKAKKGRAALRNYRNEQRNKARRRAETAELKQAKKLMNSEQYWWFSST